MYVSEDKFYFLDRWKKKGLSYDLNDVSQCFDAFFTAYVPFNFLYDFLAPSISITESNKIPIKVPKIFLSPQVIASDDEIKASVNVIHQLGEAGCLNLKNPRWDKKQIEKLSSNDPMQFSSGVLEIIYGIRCNMFHGEKPVEERQKRILIPCVRILRRLNDLMGDKLRENQIG